MKFEVEEAVNGYTMRVDDDANLHVARTVEEIAEIVVKMLGEGATPSKEKKTRKPRGKNKKKAAVTTNAADTLSGLNT